MKKIIIILMLFLVFCNISCTRQDVYDTGISSPYFDGTIMDYLRSDDYNWQLTVEMIEHAGLTDLFEGKVDTCPEITCWGIKSHVIQRYLLHSKNGNITGEKYATIKEMPAKLCRDYILRYVTKGKFLKKDIAYRNPEFLIGAPEQDGGSDFTCLAGNKVRAYLEKREWNGIPDVGPVIMSLFSLTIGLEVGMDTPDIQPRNGVVHAVSYNHILGKI